MPGFVGNYKLPSTGGSEKVYRSLGCKLVTSFESNADRDPPSPAIMATITLMNPETGKLEALVEGTEITTWRTAAASLVATKHLYFNRPSIKCTEDGRVLSIVGCGVQGDIHSIAFALYFEQIREIRVYNRTHSKRDALYEKLMAMRSSFKNPNLVIIKSGDAADCVREADIIVTATRSAVPMIKRGDLKKDVHINGEIKDSPPVLILLQFRYPSQRSVLASITTTNCIRTSTRPASSTPTTGRARKRSSRASSIKSLESWVK